MEDIANKIASIIEKPLTELGYSLYEIKFNYSKTLSSLSISVDRVKPISLDEIVEVSDLISSLLDKEDPIEGAYNLDVSSAGAEKKIRLEDLDEYTSSYLNIHLSHPYKGENILEGTLIDINQESATMEFRVKGKLTKATFPRKDIDKARLAIKF